MKSQTEFILEEVFLPAAPPAGEVLPAAVRQWLEEAPER